MLKTFSAHLAIAAQAARSGAHIPATSAAVLEARGIDLLAFTERHQNN